MLEVIRDSLRPFATPQSARELNLEGVLAYFRANPKGSVSALADQLGCSKHSTERLVAELKKGGCPTREGSARSGAWKVRP